MVDLKGFPPQGGDKLRLPQAHGKMKTALSDGFHFGGPEGIRTLDLSDANRTLSQLSYKPEYEVVCLVDEFARWVLTTLPKFSATSVAKILAARFLRDKVAIYGLCSPS